MEKFVLYKYADARKESFEPIASAPNVGDVCLRPTVYGTRIWDMRALP